MSIAATARERVSTFLTASIFDNPVVTKEFRTRMRGWKAFGVMGTYCLVMAAVLMIAYYFMAEEYSRRGMSSSSVYTARVSIGRDLFVVLAWAQTILLTLIAPALSAGSVTQELERKTLEMLALSPLTAGRIVLGKQLADFMYTLILLACSLPLAGITLMLGGISPAEIGITFMLLAAWTFLLTCLGTMLSSLSKKTAIASLSSFGLSIIYLIYASATGAALMMMSYRGVGMSHMSLNPFMLLCPAWGPYGALESATVCGVRVSIALASFTLHVAYGVLFLLVATSHVMHKPAERALPIRLMLIGITIYSTWLGVGSVQTPPQKVWLSTMGISLLAYMIVAAVFFSTGRIRKPLGQSMFSYAFSWRRVFKSDVGGAICFMLLWTAIHYACQGAAMHFQGKAQSLTFPHGYWTAYLRIGVSILAVVVGMTCVGILASSLVRARNSAAALVVLFAVVAFAGYGIIASYYAFWRSMGNLHPNQALLQLAALWPVTPILSAAGTFSKGDAPRWIHSAWIITSLIYVLIGAASLLLAGKAHAKTGGVQEE